MVVAAMYVMIVLNHLVTKNIYITYAVVLGLLFWVYKSRFWLRHYHMIEGQFLKNLYNKGEDSEQTESDASSAKLEKERKDESV